MTRQEVFHFSDSPLLVGNLINIWETVHDQILSHGAGRLIPDGVKALDMPLRVLNFGLDPSHNEDSLDLVPNYDPADMSE